MMMVVATNSANNDEVTGSTMDGRMGGVSSQDTMVNSNNNFGMKFQGATLSSTGEEGSLNNVIGNHFITRDSH